MSELNDLRRQFYEVLLDVTERTLRDARRALEDNKEKQIDFTIVIAAAGVTFKLLASCCMRGLSSDPVMLRRTVVHLREFPRGN